MHPEEHLAWARLRSHPGEERCTAIPAELQAAVNFELEHSASETDEFRQGIVDTWRALAHGLQPAYVNALDTVDERILPVVSRLHVPLIQHLCALIEFEDTLLPTRLMHGFPLTGPLDSCGIGVGENTPVTATGPPRNFSMTETSPMPR